MEVALRDFPELPALKVKPTSFPAILRLILGWVDKINNLSSSSSSLLIIFIKEQLLSSPYLVVILT